MCMRVCMYVCVYISCELLNDVQTFRQVRTGGVLDFDPLNLSGSWGRLKQLLTFSGDRVDRYLTTSGLLFYALASLLAWDVVQLVTKGELSSTTTRDVITTILVSY